MAIETNPNQPPVSPSSFTGSFPQVVEGGAPAETNVFPSYQSHLTKEEIQKDGTNWVKVFTITAILLLLMDAGIYGFNMIQGETNPDLLAPIAQLLPTNNP